MTLGLIFIHFFAKTHFGAFSVFHTKSLLIVEDKKNPNSKMMHLRKILTPEVKGNERFSYGNFFFYF